MSEQTPLQKLDDAIHEFLDEVDDDNGAVTGWVLSWQKSKISDSSDVLPLSFASDFTMSAGTSPELALGLARLTQRRIEVIETTEWDDDDD